MIVKRHNFRVREALVAGSPEVVFVFTAMGTKLGHYGWFWRRLNRQGYNVVIYDYPVKLIHQADFGQWQKLYADVAKDVAQRIEALKAQEITRFYAYGVSVGTLIANKIAQDLPDISHVVLSLTYGDLAKHLMTSPATRKARRTMLGQGINEDELRHQVAFIDPLKNAKHLRGKKVLLHLARRDKVLVYDETINLKKAFEANGVDYEYQESRHLGHLLAGTKHMLRMGRLNRFFRS